MGKALIDQEGQEDGLGGRGPAIGLLIADTAADRLCMIALFCRDPSGSIEQPMSIQVPLSAMRMSHDRDSARRLRFCEPVAGEVFHFAQALPGGVAIRRNDSGAGNPTPSIVVSKLVASDQWECALDRSRAWASGCQTVFSRVIERAAWRESRLLAGPGSLSDPGLEQFRSLVLSVAQELRAPGRGPETSLGDGIEVLPIRGFR